MLFDIFDNSDIDGTSCSLVEATTQTEDAREHEPGIQKCFTVGACASNLRAGQQKNDEHEPGNEECFIVSACASSLHAGHQKNHEHEPGNEECFTNANQIDLEPSACQIDLEPAGCQAALSDLKLADTCNDSQLLLPAVRVVLALDALRAAAIDFHSTFQFMPTTALATAYSKYRIASVSGDLDAEIELGLDDLLDSFPHCVLAEAYG